MDGRRLYTASSLLLHSIAIGSSGQQFPPRISSTPPTLRAGIDSVVGRRLRLVCFGQLSRSEVESVACRSAPRN